MHENTPRFGSNLIAAQLGNTHRVMELQVCPSSLGYPVRRMRKVTIAVRRDFVVVLELEDWLSMMGRRVVMPAESYFCLGQCSEDIVKTQRYVTTEKAALLASRARCLASCLSSTNGEISWYDCLLESQKERLDKFNMQVLPPRMAKGQAGEGDAMIVDLDQNPVQRLRMCNGSVVGECLPCHISHGCLWSTKHKRPLLSHEVLLSQGCNVVPEISGIREVSWPALKFLERGMLSPFALAKLGGMAWHIPTMGQLLAFFLASVRRCDWQLRRSLASFVFDDDAEEASI